MFINALMALQWTLMDDQGTINHKRLPNNFTLLDSLSLFIESFYLFN